MHFWAAWCEPCAFLDTVLAQLAADAPAVAALRVEAEEAADISEAYSISVVPCFLFLRGGQVADRLEGADAAALTAKFAALAAGPAAAAAAAPVAAAAAAPAQVGGSGGDLQARLKQLVKQKPVMLFMKVGGRKEEETGRLHGLRVLHSSACTPACLHAPASCIGLLPGAHIAAHG